MYCCFYEISVNVSSFFLQLWLARLQLWYNGWNSWCCTSYAVWAVQRKSGDTLPCWSRYELLSFCWLVTKFFCHYLKKFGILTVNFICQLLFLIRVLIFQLFLIINAGIIGVSICTEVPSVNLHSCYLSIWRNYAILDVVIIIYW